VPLAAGKVPDLGVMTDAFVAFVAFTLAASAVYIVNDVRDVEKDRLHPTKSTRPIAAGTVSPRTALGAAALFSFAALAIPAVLGEWGLLAIVVAYAVLQAGYQAGLRDVVLLDIVIVAAGFVLRAVAGGVASEVLVSNWFLMVTGASALFVVSAKRFGELVTHGTSTRESLGDYTESYLRTIWTSSMFAAVVFYALWAVDLGSARDDDFAVPSTVPFSLIMLRYAFHADRGKAETPEAIVLSDRVMQVLAAAWVGLFLLQVT
jgi:decaprenyl-phosphate phosphoribosyltransferase